MAEKKPYLLSEQEKEDLAGLVKHLRQIPSHTRHTLAGLNFDLYLALLQVETDAKRLADLVEATTTEH